MITENGYSKDPGLMPEGIALTLPVAFFQDRGMSYAQFEKLFYRYMQREDAIWNYRLTNLPLHDVAYVYLIYDGFLQCRANLVQYERNVAKTFYDAPDGKVREFPPSNWVLLTGPVVKAPYERRMKGFQGFRYTTKLF